MSTVNAHLALCTIDTDSDTDTNNNESTTIVLNLILVMNLKLSTLPLFLVFLTSHTSLAFVATSSSSNRTSTSSSLTKNKKNLLQTILAAPLELDTALGLQKNDDESSSFKPRGVVLNAAVGGLVGAGGLLGYITKGSKASLMAGGTFGALLLTSAAWIAKGNGRAGNRMGALVASMLSYFMGKKFVASGKFMPAGLITVASSIALIYNVVEGFAVFKSSSSTTTTGDDSES